MSVDIVNQDQSMKSVAILVVDNPDEGSIQDRKFGPLYFGHCFKSWISRCSHAQFAFDLFNTIQGEFPPSPSAENAKKYDLYMITGSRHGAYEDIPWIRELEAWIRKCDESKSPLIGICFGHQVIATALSGVVSLNPKGWEIGMCDFTLSEAGKQVFGGSNNSKSTIRLLYTHQDAVVTLPPYGVENLGGNEKTECQGMRKAKHIVTLQGHPEFSHEDLDLILKDKLSKRVINEELYNNAVKDILEKNDSDHCACSMLDYLGLHH